VKLLLVVATAAVLVARPGAAQDVLVLQGGERRAGAVGGCREDACTLDGTPVARGTIAWVGLQQAIDAATPSPFDALRDEVHLRNGRVAGGTFEALTLGAVAIGGATHDREDVAWIRFAAAEVAVPPTPPRSSPSPSSSPSSPPAARRCPPNAPLGGSIVQEVRSRGPEMNCSGQGELWFQLAPPAGSVWPFTLHGAHQASLLSYRIRIDGCQAVMSPSGMRCTVPEKDTFGTIPASGSSLGLSFTPLLPELTFETLPETVALVSVGDCRGRDGSVTGPTGWTVRPGGTIRAPSEDDDARLDVTPGACADPPPALRPDCDARPDRYAVIPFQGTGTLRDATSIAGWTTETTTRWNVCCGCGQRAAGVTPATR
jgi:hypothetical protein